MFIPEVFAADVNNTVSVSIASFVPLILIFVVFYFFIIRPNHKKLKEHRRMIDQIKCGDMIITSGGIIGEVNKVDEADAQFLLEIAPKVEIRILKSAISEILNKENQKPISKFIEKGKVESSGKKSRESKKDKNVF